MKNVARACGMCVWILLIPMLIQAQSTDLEALLAELEPTIQEHLLERRIPSLTIALVSGDRVVWSKGYGQSNLWARTPAVPSTVYLIGSITKTMQAVALLQQMEQGHFQLDDRVNDYLTDFQIRGEDPANPVTFRHLLTHVSGIPGQAERGFPDWIDPDTDGDPLWDRPFKPYSLWGDELPPSIAEYVSEVEVTRPPLERMVYSPLAFTLIAYLTEHFSGVPYKQYLSDNIWLPLEMTSTSFEPTPQMDERFAVPYVVRNEVNVPVSRYRIGIWPTGSVYATVIDLANWLIANVNGGAFAGRRIVAEEILAESHTRQFAGHTEIEPYDPDSGFGLGWRVSRTGNETFISHGGSLPGESAFALANLDRKLGVAILTNGDRAQLAPLAYTAIGLLGQYTTGSRTGAVGSRSGR